MLTYKNHGIYIGYDKSINLNMPKMYIIDNGQNK